MARILLNESDPVRRRMLKTRIERNGHIVRSLKRPQEIGKISGETGIDIMIVDMDEQSLDDLSEEVSNLNGIKLLLQASRNDLRFDFRSWIADDVFCKSDRGENMMVAINKALRY